MTELEQIREQINEVDGEMAELFERRMSLVERVADYKAKRGLPIEDEGRERMVIERASRRISNETFKDYYINFIKNVIKLSRRYQHRILRGTKSAYSGVPGAFAEIVSKRIFPGSETENYKDFAKAYEAVERGECDNAVLPLENSTNGDVGQVMDLSFFGSLHIHQVREFEIVQNLLAVPGADLSDIDTVISHPQALGQCAGFIKEHDLKQIEAVNTAVAAAEVAKSGKKNIAAIGSEEAAEEYGLVVVRSHINDESGNTTRFAVFSKIAKAEDLSDNRFIMVFTVDNKAGSLSKAINVIGEHGINLVSLKSRPTKDPSWTYYFFVEGEGNIYSDNCKVMLNRLKSICPQVKVLGSYKKEI